ncbi:28S ribosomal protein S2, mitochondrial [Trichonephila inaurata madagascariensis]|uniref:Small ribosomal subunit protein uS2m n=1 Tax=Trichonephila inaurata madagascariensis TaxID=2747483 RepID=A0A8X6MM23_9ARAC|nr:28S ribosomal protein S2, mitochondrial [Trichonephila inaurata madagascariensis]
MAMMWRAFKSAVQLPKNYQFTLSHSLKTLSSLPQSQISVDAKQSEEISNTLEMPDPLDYPDFFQVSNLFTVEDLFKARVHYGHTMGTLNEHMKQFILGSRLGTLIFDLDQTAVLLKEALNFTAHIAFRGGIILFVARYKQNSHLIEKTALECGEYSHTKDWRRGTFTDSNRFGMMTRLPELTIFLNTLNSVFETHTGVLESNKLLIPSVGIVDTNCFPNYITYPVPGNDDSPQAIELYCKLFKEAILRGKAKRKEFIEKYQHIIEDSD